MNLESFETKHIKNSAAEKSNIYGKKEQSIICLEEFKCANREISSWPDYAPTPLVHLSGIANYLRLGSLFHKDEGYRFELQSFKALGGAYAISKILKDMLHEKFSLVDVSNDDLKKRRYEDITSQITFCAATDGNHGKSVAWGASQFGCKSKIYLHSGVSQTRESEIAKYGADIIRVKGSYDDSVKQCALDAEKNSWSLVADTNAGGGSEDVPKLVMQGYTILVQEIIDQLAETKYPTHVFVPGGVGGLAAAVASHFHESLGEKRPKIIVVEPNSAACIFKSVQRDRIMKADGDLETFMACLSAGEVSPVAWPIIRSSVDHVIAIPDAAAIDAMKILAMPPFNDQSVNAGESGVAAIAGIISCAQKNDLREKLDLTEDSIVVAIGSEGVTDNQTFERVTGLKIN